MFTFENVFAVLFLGIIMYQQYKNKKMEKRVEDLENKHSLLQLEHNNLKNDNKMIYENSLHAKDTITKLRRAIKIVDADYQEKFDLLNKDLKYVKLNHMICILTRNYKQNAGLEQLLKNENNKIKGIEIIKKYWNNTEPIFKTTSNPANYYNLNNTLGRQYDILENYFNNKNALYHSPENLQYKIRDELFDYLFILIEERYNDFIKIE